MDPKKSIPNPKRKRNNEELLINKKVKNSNVENVPSTSINSKNNVTSGIINKKATTKTRKIPFNNIVNDTKRFTALPVPKKIIPRPSGKANVKASGKSVNYGRTVTKSCPIKPLKLVTKSMTEKNRSRAGILESKQRLQLVTKSMTERSRSRAGILESKMQLAKSRREMIEIKKRNEAIRSRISKIRDDLVRVENEHETLFKSIEQMKKQTATYNEEMKKLNEHCDVANEESNKLSEIILESRKGLELRNNKIIEKRLLYEYQLKQIQEIYAGLKAEENTRKDLHNQNLDLMGNIRVMCRVRPYTDKEKEIEQVSLECFDDKHTIQVSTKRLRLWQMQIEKSTYEFDHVFNTSADQKEVYLELSPLVQSAIDGYNVCIFAYGQTGSGKTYTMEGNVNSPEKKGVIPRSIDEIFDKIEETNKLGWNFEDRKKSFKEDRKKSFKESKDLCKIVYNEDTRMTIIENAERLKISKKKDMEILIGKASNRRSKSSTNSNSVSSRSHGVFILHLEGENPLEKMSSRGSLSLVDLAGSENIDKSGSVGDQMTEAQSINKSLFYLRYVIQQIKDKSNHVNYRDSVLTSLLKYSLGGTAKVCMLVNVSPSTDSTNETKKSLSFGQDARKAHVGTAMRNGKM
ncbi:unnamed protein product [Rhizophagus irregularis]|nr:unnamed protein product [Rhizophagus irregularis]